MRGRKKEDEEKEKICHHLNMYVKLVPIFEEGRVRLEDLQQPKQGLAQDVNASFFQNDRRALNFSMRYPDRKLKFIPAPFQYEIQLPRFRSQNVIDKGAALLKHHIFLYVIVL